MEARTRPAATAPIPTPKPMSLIVFRCSAPAACRSSLSIRPGSPVALDQPGGQTDAATVLRVTLSLPGADFAQLFRARDIPALI